MAKLKGKTALITGGSRGIGAAIAERLAQEGADVAITYAKFTHAAENVLARARTQGVKGRSHASRLWGPRSPQAGRRRSRPPVRAPRYPREQRRGLFSGPESTDEQFERMVNTNVRAVFVASREAAKVMPEGGRIINIGSNLGERVPFPGAGLYVMSKSAVAGFTRAWARDLGQRRITVNCVQPSPINTDMNPEDNRFLCCSEDGDRHRPLWAAGRGCGSGGLPHESGGGQHHRCDLEHRRGL